MTTNDTGLGRELILEALASGRAKTRIMIVRDVGLCSTRKAPAASGAWRAITAAGIHVGDLLAALVDAGELELLRRPGAKAARYRRRDLTG